MAPPTPWTKRAPTSIPWLPEIPQTSEASVNSTRPLRKDAASPDEVTQALPDEQRQTAESAIR